MGKTGRTSTIKNIMGEIPLAIELYWQLRQQIKPPKGGYSWQKLEKNLPELVNQAKSARDNNAQLVQGKRLLFFCGLRYWIEHATLLSLAMAGYGHQVTLAYVPYIKWKKDYSRFDKNILNIRVREILKPAAELIDIVSFLDIKPADNLPPELVAAVEEVSTRDVQYTLQVEEFDKEGRLYRLRLERNTEAALAALTWMRKNRPDTLITPNGSILEMGVIYAVARHLDIPVVTYEFGEQRERIWLARNAEVMNQKTDDLWAARQDDPLSEPQWEQIRALYASRQSANLWDNFARLWQGEPAKGGVQVREELDLDDRPVVLLPANVIGDSLTLGRQVFSQTMTEWLEKSVQYFAKRQDIQLLVRVHPGERYITGPSVADVVHRALPDLETNPDLSHIHLVAALDPINTYDLIEIADLGIAYTTTVGMEMVMSGVPVIMAGQTHYRGKGFTLDPDSWETYFNQLDQALQGRQDLRLTRQQVEQAWNYAYLFFFEYPLPFPWHLLDFWEKLETWPMSRVVSEEGWLEFRDAFQFLAGEPRSWSGSLNYKKANT